MALSASEKAQLASIIGSTTPAKLIEDLSASSNLLIFAEKAAAVADLNQTIAGPTIGEVQAISDKVDALLAALRTGNILSA